jgi:hypothetical protein
MRTVNLVTGEFYIEYLGLKEELIELATEVERAHLFQNADRYRETYQKALDKKVARMHIVLEQLRLGGVSAEKLLFLALGVDLDEMKAWRKGWEKNDESL